MVNALKEAFSQFANPVKAEQMSAYMKHHFVFYGIPAPVRKSIQSDIFSQVKIHSSEELLEVVKLLWQAPQRELHYAAMELLAKYKKFWKPESIGDFEQLITSHSWWDSVDTLSSHLIGPLFKKYPDLRGTYINLWKNSDNMWLRRVCIIHQLGYKHDTDTDMLTEMILLNNQSAEFFLQKAIGWSLRQYAKYNPEWVLRFVEIHPLKNLSKREAVKNIRM